jgi:pimeloyl-ACP methyl ester carboxylesterase
VEGESGRLKLAKDQRVRRRAQFDMTHPAELYRPSHQKILDLRTDHLVGDVILVDGVGPDHTPGKFAQQIHAAGDSVDIVAFMDALKIEKATLAGFDWGARTVNIIAALWPERCKAMVSVSGYLIGRQDAVASKE